MKSLCTKSIRGYKEGVIYSSCPVLSGYQVSVDTDHRIDDCDIKSIHVFLDSTYANHFRTIKGSQFD